MSDHDHDHDHGLFPDLERMGNLQGRRRVLQMLGGVGLLPLLACSSGSAAGSAGLDASAVPDGGLSSGTAPGSCAVIPEETAGPYPGDGSNGVNALTTSGVVRRDIRSSFGGTMTGTATGVPLTVKLVLVNTNDNCALLEGYAVYLWHATADGKYSLYTLPGENYLRGVQQSDANGEVSFQTIFPGCYDGRWPHIHFEIYPAIASITSAKNKIRTSQLAMPKAACDAVYQTAPYAPTSATNLAKTSLSSDNVFSDNQGISQLPTISGNAADGYVATLTVGVSV